jgi:predicted CXXCH cytochrome family protein
MTPTPRSARALLALCASLLSIATLATHKVVRAQPPENKAHFVGSKQCQSCHADLYASWQQTRMANVIRDPKEHPEAVLGDFSHPDPNLKFSLDQVAWVYGSRWKQRYFARRGDDYYVLPSQWDIRAKRWLPYHVPDKGGDWWTAYYPSDNTQRPTGPLCDGCHSVNYDIATKQPTEWNVGCEKCHGPGSEHVAHPTTANIVNPDKLDVVRSNDVCMQCHTQGQPSSNPVHGKYYDWPVGFLPGQRLADIWRLEEHKLGDTDFFYWPDNTAHKNRMQGNDSVQSVMYHRDIRCSSCHNVHSGKHTSDLVLEGNRLCLGCHTGSKVPGPGTTQTVEQHTHHAANSAGSQCVACHMPAIEQTLAETYVAAHTFRFISPKLTQQFGMPNACNLCHKDKDAAWSLAQLNTWKTVSPWRVLQ